jgi:hypothetical protein
VHALRTRSNLTIEREGVNFIRQVVEGAGCLFKEINLQHDFGHDATIILAVDGEVQPREIALQIKSGKTYNRPRICRIPVRPSHVTFWAKHDLLTLGVVYDPSDQSVYWVDLRNIAQGYQRNREPPKSVLFSKSVWNRFDHVYFKNVLVQRLIGKAPLISIEEAIRWSNDPDFDTHTLGVQVLLSRYFTHMMAWEALITLFRSRHADALTQLIPAAFSKLLGNWDLSYTFTTARLTPEVENFARTAVSSFGPSEIAKLLEFLDYEEGWDFTRGSLGRALLTIVEAQKNMQGSLYSITADPEFRTSIRRMAKELHDAYSTDRRWYWD